MENKYYTPKLEELFVGYECLKFLPKKEAGLTSEAFSPYIINADDFKLFAPSVYEGYTVSFAGFIPNDPGFYFRTPFLTKEQILKEGWEFTSSNDTFHEFKKGFYNIAFWEGFKLAVEPDKDYWRIRSAPPRYNGTCPSINEFRTIIKLLNI